LTIVDRLDKLFQQSRQIVSRGGVVVLANPVRVVKPYPQALFAGALALFTLFALLAPAAQAQTSFFTVAPCRVLDTRDAVGAFGGPALPSGGTRIVNLAGRCGISTGAAAVSANITVVGPTSAGYLSLFPAGSAPPATSTLNYKASSVRANNAVLPLGADGAVAVITGQPTGSVSFIVDVNGYFADPAIDQTVTAPPVLTPPPGSYNGTQTIALFTSTAGASIRYTTDGSVPTSATGTLYSAPLSLPATATVKAIAYKSGLADSSVVSGLYTITHLPTLFVATLVPEAGVQSPGSGSATLLLAGDEASAVLRFSFSNLTTAVTGEHTHGPADPGTNGQILFDIDSATPEADGSFVWTFVPVGTATVPQIVDAIRTGRVYLNIHTSSHPTGEIRGHFGLATGGTVFVPPPPPPPLPGGPPTARDAARFLHQATYGPTSQEISSLQSQGFDAWLNQQFQVPLTSHLAYLDAAVAAGEEPSSNQVMESIWKQAVQGPDPLRQRVALALSEIFVISDVDGDVGSAPDGMASYMDLLERDAFGNFRTLLQDVTLSPTMGVYLDMLGNDKENPERGSNPNENYAREILQLFSIGLLKVFPDGTLQLGADGLPIETYDQETVKGFARVFTGWSFAGGNTNDPDDFYWPPKDYRQPMVAWPSHHSTGVKTLLDGASTPTGLSPQQDLQTALDNIFYHPNVGPFFARLLIQRLVTSNPSPGYVYRVASAFNNDGQGVRGDMKAVIRAVLLDYEARAEEATANQGYGHLREPIVRLGGLLRAFSAAAPSGKFRLWYLEDPTWGIGQNPLRAPTVFNFFKPGFSLPGPVAQAGLTAPEFQIFTETTTISTANFMRYIIYHGYEHDGDIIALNLTPQIALAGNPTQLVDSLNLLLMANSMSSQMRTILINTISPPNMSNPTNRTKAALRLIVTSPEYLVQR
jgi:uncharacterized protein (DUF1800 family)